MKLELTDTLRRLKQIHLERRNAAAIARPALHRLVEAMRHGTGQGYKLRALLYSLWNGKETSLSEVLGLDWALRQDLCAVMLAFGFEEPHNQFFYDAIRAEVTDVHLWDWFIEEGECQ